MESIPSSPMVKRPGESLSLSCRGSGFTFSCCVMIWVRETSGKPLELLGTGFSSPSRNSYASSVRGRVEISREDSNSLVYLRLSNLKPEDSAVYYCARVNTVVHEVEWLYKNPRGWKRNTNTTTALCLGKSCFSVFYEQVFLSYKFIRWATTIASEVYNEYLNFKNLNVIFFLDKEIYSESFFFLFFNWNSTEAFKLSELWKSLKQQCFFLK